MRRSLPTAPRTTPRLLLRPFRRRDVDPLLTAALASLPELSRWLPWAYPGYGRGDAVRFVRDSAAAWTEGRAYDFAIRAPDEPDTHLGNISVWPTSRRERAGEVGYWIATAVAGRGLATEAAARVLQVAFEELDMHRVILRVAVGNRASERVAEKLGFVREGVLRKEVFVHGVWMDHTLYGLLVEEYRHHRPRYVETGWLGTPA
jgi:RimJ/RimL family protein N-acetyltransferase